MQAHEETTGTLAVLKLKKNEDRRLRAGHLWVYSNEVDTTASPLGQYEPGQLVEIQASGGRALGTGYINPHSLICARLVSRSSEYWLNHSLLVHRIQVALSLRERLYGKPYYRLVYGEGDGLPGLVVDRFGDYLVAQITTAGMERVRDEVVSALRKVLQPAGILFRNDSSIRAMEGLESYSEVVHGDIPERVRLEENGVPFDAPLAAGQKTGWFYDHRESRARLGRYVQGSRVLDLFSYLGGWGVQAAVNGAEHVTCVDSSEAALGQLLENAALNNVQDKITALQGDAFDALKSLRDERTRFDVVVLDPPAFIKRKKDMKNGLEAYRRLNELAMRLLSRDGILVSASCSFHLSRKELQNLLLKTSRHLDRNLTVLEQGFQGPDHPVHPAIPETEYLKAVFCRVLPV